MDGNSKKAQSLKKRIASELIPYGAFMFAVILGIGFMPYFHDYNAELATPYKQRLIADARERGIGLSFSIDDGLLVKVDGIVTREGSVIVEKNTHWPILISYCFGFALYVVFVGYWKRTAKLEDEEAGSKTSAPKEGIADEFLRVSSSVRRDADRQFLQARLMLMTGILVATAGVVVFATILDFERSTAARLEASPALAARPSSYTYIPDPPPRESGDREWLEKMATLDGVDEKKLIAILSYREKMKQIDKDAPQPETSSDLLSRFVPTARSFALFLAIEAIAWFLLRQYRFAIADFKQIYRVYLRRESLLIAWQISQTGNAEKSGVPLAVLGTLLQEDQVARLLKEESTEIVEEIKATDEKNWIPGVINSFVGNWRKS